MSAPRLILAGCEAGTAAEASFSDFPNLRLDLFLIFRNKWLRPVTLLSGARRTLPCSISL